MAKKTRISKLAQKLEDKGVERSMRHEKAKAPGGGSLPAGIENGIAKLTRVDFNEIESGTYKGEQRFYAHGTAVQPAMHDGQKVRGRLVQLSQIVLADTKSQQGQETSFEENLAKAENRCKLLGFPTEEFDDLEAEVLEYFEEEKDTMYFKYRTWKPADSDRVLVTLVGPAEDYDPSEHEDEDDVEDDTEEEEEVKPAKKGKKAVEPEDDDEDEEEEEPAPAKKGKKAKPEPEEDEEDDEEEEDDDDAAVDLTKLVKKADGGNTQAQLAIAKEAKKVGVDPEDPDFEDWADVVAAVKKAQKSKPAKADDDEEDEDEEEGTPIVPEKGQVYGYKPKGKKKTYEFQVTKVLKKARTVNLSGVDSDLEYEDISWDDLVEVEA